MKTSFQGEVSAEAIARRFLTLWVMWRFLLLYYSWDPSLRSAQDDGTCSLLPHIILAKQASKFLFDVVEGCLFFLGMDLGGVGDIVEVGLLFVGKSR